MVIIFVVIVYYYIIIGLATWKGMGSRWYGQMGPQSPPNDSRRIG